MLGSLVRKLFGSRNDRIIKDLSKNVRKINALEESMQALDDEALQAKTKEFKERLANGTSLDGLLVEAFAVVREAARRVLGMRHYDVQLIGGMVLHMGKIAEMRTGEGKTLVATLAVYLNALTGRGVHVVTVNDYLARRDGEELSKLYNFLGLSVGIIVSGMDNEAKKAAYRADITYGTNNEFGFDYLRTNMMFSPEDRLQRELHFAIVDEVDSILIDEARTPLIISGAANTQTDLYEKLNALMPKFSRRLEEDGEGDFSVDEKARQIELTESGHEHVESLLVEEGLLQAGDSLYDPKNLGIFHHLNACLRAHHLYQKNVDYIVRNGEVVIVDEFTGRTMEGRRWSDGLHQAIEIKEGVAVKQETQTLASITYQNFFRLYDKLSGMTGTADTEAFEFQDIYNLETVVIPTHRPVARKDYTDLIYLKQAGKYRAIIEDVKACQARNQPVLLGTASIETSELLSDMLRKEGIKHEVLNAKQHQREAQIIADAGLPGQVTIATNMAGRGTDIVLGGNLRAQLDALGDSASEEEKEAVRVLWQERHDVVLKAGGLHVIGAERHESRRIDNQLRGRSGRQGDPGSSRFYVALDDNLVRIFAGDKMAHMMQRLGMSEDEAIESKIVSRQIEGAQRKVEAHNFDARKNLLEYDNVANEQRKVIYTQRNYIMDAKDVRDMVAQMREEVVARLASDYIPEGQLRQNWRVKELQDVFLTSFNSEISIEDWLKEDPNLSSTLISERLLHILRTIDQEKRTQYGDEIINWGEKIISLDIIDKQWKAHLSTLDMLRQAIWLRSRAQKDPRQEYKRESFELFSEMLFNIQMQIVSLMTRFNYRVERQVESDLQAANHENQEAFDQAEKNNAQESDIYANVGRNEPCPCGSGKRFKNCHGKIA